MCGTAYRKIRLISCVVSFQHSSCGLGNTDHVARTSHITWWNQHRAAHQLKRKESNEKIGTGECFERLVLWWVLAGIKGCFPFRFVCKISLHTVCQVYKNPFNYGKLHNWKVFLGVEKRRWVFFFLMFLSLLFVLICLWPPDLTSVCMWTCSHWVTRVLLPSAHLPFGDGLTWDSYPIKKELILV